MNESLPSQCCQGIIPAVAITVMSSTKHIATVTQEWTLCNVTCQEWHMFVQNMNYGAHTTDKSTHS